MASKLDDEMRVKNEPVSKTREADSRNNQPNKQTTKMTKIK